MFYWLQHQRSTEIRGMEGAPPPFKKVMLSRLTINVSHICNLDCVYCYAGGGSYNGPSIKMTSNISDVTVDEVLRQHNNIDLIQFFGGEPLTNMSVVKRICEKITNSYNEGLLLKMPSFSIISNLTLLEDDDIEFLSENNFNIVVSLDGGESIHDKLRPTKDGKGTYDIINSNIEKLYLNKIKYSIEATYTKIHYTNSISITNLVNQLNKLNASRIDVVVVGGKGNSNIFFQEDSELELIYDDFFDAFRFFVNSLSLGNFIPFGPLIDSFGVFSGYNDEKLFCPAGNDNLSISADGLFYPCHMFVNSKDFLIENKTLPEEINKNTISDCNKCWARPWCKLCLGKFVLFSNQDKQYLKSHCQLNKNIISYSLQEIPEKIEQYIKSFSTH